MPIYVDEHCHWTKDRCHLATDGPDQLREVAALLRLGEDRIQYPGTRDEHVDLTFEERADLLAFRGIFRVAELSNEQMYRHVKARSDEDYREGRARVRYVHVSETAYYPDPESILKDEERR